MTDEAQRWKEKYLKSIEQQEKLEPSSHLTTFM